MVYSPKRIDQSRWLVLVWESTCSNFPRDKKQDNGAYGEGLSKERNHIVIVLAMQLLYYKISLYTW